MANAAGVLCGKTAPKFCFGGGDALTYNPFTKMAGYGLTLELPPASRPPDGPVLRNLIMMWSRVVKQK